MKKTRMIAITLIMTFLSIALYLRFQTQSEKNDSEPGSHSKQAERVIQEVDKSKELAELKESYARLKAQKAKRDETIANVQKLYSEAEFYKAKAEETDKRRREILDGKTVDANGQIALSADERRELNKVLEKEKQYQKDFLASYQDFKRNNQ